MIKQIWENMYYIIYKEWYNIDFSGFSGKWIMKQETFTNLKKQKNLGKKC